MKSFIILLLVAVVTASGNKCGKNEHFVECGSRCPLTCDNFENPPSVCAAMCVIGCQCNEGFVRARGGRCVKPENCPRNRTELDCPENKEFGSFGDCPPSCLKNPPKFCTLKLNFGCKCKEGYVLTKYKDYESACVKPEDCPDQSEGKNCVDKPDPGFCLGYFPKWYYDEEAKDCKQFIYGGCPGNGNRYDTKEQCLKKCANNCPANSHYEVCGTACPTTCENYENPPEECSFICVSGCFCDDGYVQTKEGKCVKPERCAAENCTGNTTAGYFTSCVPRCDTNGKPPEVCSYVISYGCTCKEGYLLVDASSPIRCVKKLEDCPGYTGGKNCVDKPDPGFCLGYFPKWYYDEEAKDCKQFIYGGCPGNGNRYDTKEQCLKKCAKNCPANSHYENCGTACPTTCENYENPPEVCVLNCVSGCFCDDGYFKTEEGKCVKPERCAVEKKNCVDDPEPVLCEGYFPMWYYDKRANDCKQFIYGGCPGNGNRYATKEQCLKKCAINCGKNAHFTNCGSACPKTCDSIDNSSRACPAVCVTGCQCDKGFVRTSGGCCVKPENCPRNRTDPEKNCVDEKKTGPCKSSVPSWYYNKETRKCERFIYGGCKGNGNRYGSEEECKNNCVDE